MCFARCAVVSVAVRVFTNYQSPITGAARALCAAPAAPRTPPPPALGSDSAPPETRSAAERQTPRFAYTNHPRLPGGPPPPPPPPPAPPPDPPPTPNDAPPRLLSRTPPRPPPPPPAARAPRAGVFGGGALAPED